MNETLKKVEAFANKAHGDQTRKYSSDPYIVHPVRVMTICSAYTDDIAVLAAALLHDVLEDTPTDSSTLEDFLVNVLEASTASRTLQLVVELTDIYTKQNFPQLNRRTRKRNESKRLSEVSAEAQTIKYADIIDNADVTTQDPDFARVYLPECMQLLQEMKAGNTTLRERAVKRVQECITMLKTTPSIVQ